MAVLRPSVVPVLFDALSARILTDAPKQKRFDQSIRSIRNPYMNACAQNSMYMYVYVCILMYINVY
jgi:hypothetical protein